VRRLTAGLLVALLLVPPAPLARAEPDAAALRSELATLADRYRAIEGEMRAAIAEVQALPPSTPLAERQARADRLLEMRRRLEALGAELEARRREIATLPDWYVITVQGGGVSTSRSSLGGFLNPELVRSRGSVDLVVPVPPGRNATDRAAELQRALAPPGCRRGIVPAAVSAPEFWEDLKVFVGAGPFGTRAEAEARRGSGTIGTVGVVTFANPNALLRQFGCPDQPVQRVAVPDVRGLAGPAAEARLRDAGLAAGIEVGSPAPTAAQESTVQETRPAAGTPVEPGSRVSVLVHARAVPAIAMPDLRGLRVDEAERRLADQGLGMAREDAGAAPSRAQAGVVVRQGEAPGTRLERGATVRVWVHGAHVPTREEQLAQTRCPSNAQPAWNESAGRAECRCAPGFVASGVICVVDRQAAVANLRCPANAQSTWNEGAGRAECRCAAGFVAQGNTCVIDRQAAVAAQQCPPLAEAFWDAGAGRAACRCLPGFAFDGTACSIDRSAAVAALRCPPNAEGYWDEQTRVAQCRCRGGFAWNGSSCAVDPRAAVAATRCPANAEAFWDAATGQARCRCATGFVQSGSACVVDRKAAVAALRCPPNAEAFWDAGAGSAQCRCRQGHVWNGQACALIAQQPRLPAPPQPSSPPSSGGRACPPGQVLTYTSPLGQGDAVCVPARR
jgi:hypothetical protein